jgi:hypothetical protein
VQDAPAGRAEALEARDLRLDGDGGRRHGVDDRAAVVEDRDGGRGGRARVLVGDGVRPLGGLGPEAVRIGVEAQDDLGLAVGDRGGQPVGEVAGRLTAGELRGAVQGELAALDGLLEARAGGEARDLGGGDLDRLTRARVHTLARAALGDVELAEP